MKIGLIDVDSHNFPNIPLMKLSAWHKSRGDSVEWYSPLFSDHLDIVYVSKVFSFSPNYKYWINADRVVYGGSGYAISLESNEEKYHKELDLDLPSDIEHMYPDYSLYPEQTKDTAYGFLTRGCPRGCHFCHVPCKEGRRSYKVAELSEFWKGQRNIVLCDPNILACNNHMELLQQLIDSGASIDFNQGLDLRFINEKNIDMLKKVKIKSVHFAYDSMKDMDILEAKMRWVKEATGWDKNRGSVMVYILTNYNTTTAEDIHRIQFCRELNWLPYPMIYNKGMFFTDKGKIRSSLELSGYSKEQIDHAITCRKLQRWCNPFIFWATPEFKDYKR